RAGRARERGQLRQGVLRTVREELAAHVQEPRLAPASGGLMLRHANHEPARPRARDLDAIHPVEREHARAHGFEVEREEAGGQLRRNRGLDRERRDTLERTLELERPHRAVEQRLRAEARRAERREHERRHEHPAPVDADLRNLRQRAAGAHGLAAIRATPLHRSPPAFGSPTIRTSGSSSTPNCCSTSACTIWISVSMSAAVALPVLTMKFACFCETIAPPSVRPFNPAASISRPAWSPGGLRNTEPQLGTRNGCVAARCASRRRIAVSSASGSGAKRNSAARNHSSS